MKCTANVMHLDYPETNSFPHTTTTTSPWENCLPGNWSLMPKRLGTGAVSHSVRRGLHVMSIPTCNPCVYLPSLFWCNRRHLKRSTNYSALCNFVL